MKCRIAGLLTAVLLVCIPAATRANTIAIAGGSFASAPGHSASGGTSSQFVLNFLVPRVTVNVPSFHSNGHSGGDAEHLHGLLTSGGSGFSFPSATNGSYSGAADFLLRTNFLTIPIPSGPSLFFAIHNPSWGSGGDDGHDGGNRPSDGWPGFTGNPPGGGSIAFFGDHGHTPGYHLPTLDETDPPGAPLTANPEPGTLLLMGTGMILVARTYRRRRRSA